MKSFLLPLAIASSVNAATLELTEYDQMKLAHFLNKLPSHVTDKSEDSRKVRVIFPKRSDALRVECVSEFFDNSPVPSSSSCSVEIDVNHQNIEKNYDEVRLADEDNVNANALFEIMPHGTEKKSFRSGEFEAGTDFNGRRTNIFSYLFECTETSCLYRFSEKMIK